MKKSMIPCIYLYQGKAAAGFDKDILPVDVSLETLAKGFGDAGADMLLVFDLSSGDEEHEQAIGIIREICTHAEIPVAAAGNIRRLEDVKKLLYAGCQKVILNFSKEGNVSLLPEVSRRFGKDRLGICVSRLSEYFENQKAADSFSSFLVLLDVSGKRSAEAEKNGLSREASAEKFKEEIQKISRLPVLLHTDEEDEKELISMVGSDGIFGLSGGFISHQGMDIRAFKDILQKSGIPVEDFTSSIPWSEFKLNSDGLIPVVVQDYKTDQVLMVAYMNEEAFYATLKTGRMTYYSRSRQEQWVKGLTSGHFQYVKSLMIDCDKDTLLARVDQIGAACHTGNRSCFYTTLAEKEYDDTNPLRVFENEYQTILDRKEHPKEGSYTNYLFDKGIDKILKKVGEECTEIVIAAKNPDKEEIKYEIADFLYHMMVLMAEKGVTWDDVTSEIARR